ncbi:GntR family transcriptional regulator [Kaistia dalseonensis]|uniref:DNA-binding GntR family transcriptional regulator n=1 Tax=Kaistia dalseonensis TaxID=410840 RepID=A0ABU0H995_9HYPH|nr:GntR family transcriptional regulator [Kaistia dalseonensis]MCX5495728.1 GntR family transcriptional regulator [Kaistia dalseonensis]MDQ0438325.1 DNA-binding GntR family transcriptional regulator [Kaistia dalseonensis]
MNGKPILNRVVLVDQVSALLTRRILDREYEPAARLNIDALARELQVSTSPIREALSRLTAIGLVASASFSGFSVAPEPSRAWYEQLRDFRILNEGWAAQCLAQRADRSVIERMRRCVDEMERGVTRDEAGASDYLSVSRLDAEFHDTLLDECGNPILAQSLRNLHPHLHHARLFRSLPHDIRPVVDEHRAILDAIETGDRHRAQLAVEAHLVNSWNRYCREATASGPRLGALV